MHAVSDTTPMHSERYLCATFSSHARDVEHDQFSCASRKNASVSVVPSTGTTDSGGRNVDRPRKRTPRLHLKQGHGASAGTAVE